MTTDIRNLLGQRIEREEGRTKFPYTDTQGKLTIGVGWNLTDNGLPDSIIDQLKGIALANAEAAAEGVAGYFAADPVRQSVVIAMCFQMGLGSVLRFHNFCQHFAAGQYELAADDMLDSDWARHDSPARAHRESDIMRSGSL